jgi:DNA-binding transcriptional MocR family regulator
MSNVPSPLPTVSRRRVLIGTAALAVLSATAAGCGAPTPRPEVDALVAQLERARADSELASGAATAARPQIAAALNVVAAERSAHAKALSEEIDRVAGDTPPTSSSSSSSTSTSPSGTGEPLPPPSPQDVIAALKQSADGAAQLAAQQSGYRAGLLGSIAASCTAAFTVALGGGQSS